MEIEATPTAIHGADCGPELQADGPNQVWSWDISKLHGPLAGWVAWRRRSRTSPPGAQDVSIKIRTLRYSSYVHTAQKAPQQRTALGVRCLVDAIRTAAIIIAASVGKRHRVVPSQDAAEGVPEAICPP